MTTGSWKKSSHSQNGGDCVEVRADLGAVRDTKNPDQSIRADVRALVNALRSGRLS
ncbi:hypothetical protein JOF56_002508 [Kibdelosporangium banguiense]|uniref:DUF397 domain-containing protein n=1 Tax=Kibdelosporangium banguiense TaxID=1365924 RepID=A0ABS4TCH0_9PSEU|nr:DUF397 domain-containing protein [Kibdelosporangium banguiense]MBP2322123.1 hypothetical protein [Kibdelosporangium banguiense]